jgi:hypothetical protein
MKHRIRILFVILLVVCLLGFFICRSLMALNCHASIMQTLSKDISMESHNGEKHTFALERNATKQEEKKLYVGNMAYAYNDSRSFLMGLCTTNSFPQNNGFLTSMQFSRNRFASDHMGISYTTTSKSCIGSKHGSKKAKKGQKGLIENATVSTELMHIEDIRELNQMEIPHIAGHGITALSILAVKPQYIYMSNRYILVHDSTRNTEEQIQHFHSNVIEFDPNVHSLSQLESLKISCLDTDVLNTNADFETSHDNQIISGLRFRVHDRNPSPFQADAHMGSGTHTCLLWIDYTCLSI